MVAPRGRQAHGPNLELPDGQRAGDRGFAPQRPPKCRSPNDAGCGTPPAVQWWSPRRILRMGGPHLSPPPGRALVVAPPALHRIAVSLSATTRPFQPGHVVSG